MDDTNNIDKSKIYRNIHMLMLRDPDVLHAIQKGDENYLNSLLKSYGITVPDIDDRLVITSLASSKKSAEDLESEAAKQKAQSQKDTQEAINNFQKNVDQVMQVNPTYRATRNALVAGSELSRAAGEAASNKGNALAQALLASRRHSAKQDELYGQNYLDREAATTAATAKAEGDNAKAFLNAISNTIDKVTGLETQHDEQLRQTKLAPYMAELGLPGTAWQTLGQNVKRAYSTFK